jgi:hypothetical protein
MEKTMKIRFFLINAVVVSAVSLSGCSSTDMKVMLGSGDAVSTTSGHLKPTNPEKVKIYHSKSALPKNHKIIGRVTAANYNLLSLPNSQTFIMAELKKQAATIGANGITHIATGMAQTTADAVLVK